MRIVEAAGGLGHDEHRAAGSLAPGRSGSMVQPEEDSGQHGFTGQLRDVLAARRARNLAHLQDELAGGPPGAELIKTVRKTGSKHAVAELQQRLGDDWVLVRGYHNGQGPIGQLLIGPAGLIAMTSLYLEAAVHCHRDKWHAEKHGATTHLVDSGGRSVSVQLNQSADQLQELLSAAGRNASIERVVLLNHPRSEPHSSFRPSVHIFTSTADLVTWLHKQPKALDRGARRQLEELITGKAAGKTAPQAGA